MSTFLIHLRAWCVCNISTLWKKPLRFQPQCIVEKRLISKQLHHGTAFLYSAVDGSNLDTLIVTAQTHAPNRVNTNVIIEKCYYKNRSMYALHARWIWKRSGNLTWFGGCVREQASKVKREIGRWWWERPPSQPAPTTANQSSVYIYYTHTPSIKSNRNNNNITYWIRDKIV